MGCVNRQVDKAADRDRQMEIDTHKRQTDGEIQTEIDEQKETYRHKGVHW